MTSIVTDIEDLRRLAKRRVPRMFYDYADSKADAYQSHRSDNEAPMVPRHVDRRA